MWGNPARPEEEETMVVEIGSEGAASADRRVRVTAICALALEAAAEIAAPERKRGTPTCTGPEQAHSECGWKRGERRRGAALEKPSEAGDSLPRQLVRDSDFPGRGYPPIAAHTVRIKELDAMYQIHH